MEKCKRCGHELKENYTEIKFKNKTFGIYKWENKKIGDFKYPKEFKMAEFQEFVDLIDSKKFKLEVLKNYFVKHFSKLQKNKKWCLSRVCLYSDGDLSSDSDDLRYSDVDGRVVCVK